MSNLTLPLPCTVMDVLGARLFENWKIQDTKKDPFQRIQERKVHQKGFLWSHTSMKTFQSLLIRFLCSLRKNNQSSHRASHYYAIADCFETLRYFAPALHRWKDEPRIIQGRGTESFYFWGEEGIMGQEARWKLDGGAPLIFGDGGGLRVSKWTIGSLLNASLTHQDHRPNCSWRNPDRCSCCIHRPCKLQIYSSRNFAVTKICRYHQ